MELITSILTLAAITAYFAVSARKYRKLAARFDRLRGETHKMQADLCLQLVELEKEYSERLDTLEEADATASLREEIKGLKQQVEAAILPDDSAARKAKEQIDAFNAGVFNILSYHGYQGKRHTEETDDEE